MMATIGETVNVLTARFAQAGIDNPRLDARVLIGDALGIEPSMLFARRGDAFPEERRAALEIMVKRRLAHEPVSRIRGRREFWGLDFEVTSATLDPRPDTETLVEAALRRRKPGKPARILDLGTGSGCILIALLSAWPEAHGVGIDASMDAVTVATRNAARQGISARAKFQHGIWCDGVTDRFDVIVSNPPYIADHEISTLAPEVAKFDPPLALCGGEDGLDAYRQFAPKLAARLAPQGAIFLEVGQGQAEAVAAILRAHYLPRTAFYLDLGGIARVIAASQDGTSQEMDQQG
jgi:release factor glutamine methyltransferase